MRHFSFLEFPCSQSGIEAFLGEGDEERVAEIGAFQFQVGWGSVFLHACIAIHFRRVAAAVFWDFFC
jgi:hypothetical protein